MCASSSSVRRAFAAPWSVFAPRGRSARTRSRGHGSAQGLGYRGQEITIADVINVTATARNGSNFSLCICDDIRKRHDPPFCREIFHLSFEMPRASQRKFPTRTVNRVIHKHDNLRRALKMRANCNDEKRKYRQNSFELLLRVSGTAYRHM